MGFIPLVGVVDDYVQACLREDFQSHVAALFDPLVVLLGEDRPDQADESVRSGKMPTTFGAPTDLTG